MKNAITSLGQAYKYILKDKISLLLALCPIVIGIIIYVYAGQNFFGYFSEWGQEYIEKYLGEGTLGSVVKWFVSAILMVLLYYIINLTFIMVISIIASPFNDLLSARIEKQFLGQKLPSFSESVSLVSTKLIKTIFTEIKKISMILGISILVVFTGFFPFFAPVSIILGAMVLSVEYIDFSWSRHSIEFKECKQDFKKHIVGYTFGGLFFMILITIPLVNIVVPCLATSYFTILWVKNNENRYQAS